MQTMNAAQNPAMANSIIQSIISDTEQEAAEASAKEPNIEAPSDLVVSLPGGYLTA